MAATEDDDATPTLRRKSARVGELTPVSESCETFLTRRRLLEEWEDVRSGEVIWDAPRIKSFLELPFESVKTLKVYSLYCVLKGLDKMMSSGYLLDDEVKSYADDDVASLSSLFQLFRKLFCIIQYLLEVDFDYVRSASSSSQVNVTLLRAHARIYISYQMLKTKLPDHLNVLICATFPYGKESGDSKYVPEEYVSAHLASRAIDREELHDILLAMGAPPSYWPKPGRKRPEVARPISEDLDFSAEARHF